ncbi:hypothetical protein Acid345_1297 [Candidatus Koribacter versatilis Ellin345]|uniref:Uncharacterized protein n=1 Tax=Koribacter versatilis (strain Ellin345) TaxID=204669 RepID=Q1IS51_KORVE|nr:hypothetical protein [Candidatus Koribacter versatilis]ABF40299.1 hypothetical protein Acid345_1297 [Candidatus Koribacter versatilis Ellin345]
MKKAKFAFLASCLVLSLQAIFPQGIQSNIVNLPLTGNWKQAAEIEKDSSAPGTQVFYDLTTGSVLQIRYDYQLREVTDISQQFSNAGKGASTPDGARILMSAMFPLPSKYSQAIASSIHEGHTAKLWEVRDPGNAQWFYVANLFGGYRMHGGGTSSEIQEEFLPMKINKAEHRSVAGADVLLFEAETDRPSIDAAMKRFKMPGALKDQRLRYGWIQFSPGGITSSESIISLAFATPVNSGIDVSGVLDQLAANYKKTENKN